MQMVLDLLSSSIFAILDLGWVRAARDVEGFFSDPGSFGARQEVGVQGRLRPL